MTKVKASRLIEAPHNQIWTILSDYGSVHKYNPFVERTISDAKPGMCQVGDTRRCEMYGGNAFVEEEVVSIDAGRAITLQITSSTMPFHNAIGRIEAIAVSQEQTRVNIALDYGAKGGPLIGFVMKPAMKFMLKKVLKSLEHHLKTGQPIGKNGRLVTV
jgi:ribosome-associated toxin RatA of RatAB toxin-antitoxin module